MSARQHRAAAVLLALLLVAGSVAAATPAGGGAGQPSSQRAAPNGTELQEAEPTAAPAESSAWRVDPARSAFALVTRKGGFAKGRAHDHVIAARDFQSELIWDGDPSAAAFTLRLRADQLDPDPPELRARLAKRLAELGLREGGEPAPVSQDQRAKIRETMLGPEQLDADRFPHIAVTLVEAVAQSQEGPLGATHRGTIALEAHGREVRLEFRARLEPSDETLRIEAVAPVRFTDLGIEPYSAFLGAVKNLDQATLYLELVATRRSASGSAFP